MINRRKISAIKEREKELPRLLCYMPQCQPRNMIIISCGVCIILLVHNRLTLSFIFIIAMSLHISCTHRIIRKREEKINYKILRFFFLDSSLCIYLLFARLLPYSLRIHIQRRKRRIIFAFC